MEDANITPEETRAIMDLVQPDGSRAPAEVHPRDFRQPKRLSSAQLEELSRKLSDTVKEVEGELTAWLHATHPLEVQDVGEIDARSVLAALEEPFLCLAFDVAGPSVFSQPGWLVWESPAAASTLEVVLGAEAPESAPEEARRFSTVESGVLENLLGKLALPASRAFGFEITDLRVCQVPGDLESDIDALRDGDVQRTYFHFAFEGPGQQSTLRLYLPGVRPPGEDDTTNKKPEAPDLPAHMDDVPLEVAARLGQIEIPLNELLGIEVGDVIPLGLRTGSPLDVTVEGQYCATADLGCHDGKLALRVRDAWNPDDSPERKI